MSFFGTSIDLVGFTSSKKIALPKEALFKWALVFIVALFSTALDAQELSPEPAITTPPLDPSAGVLTFDEVKALRNQSIRVARNPLRRAARTAPDAKTRALALQILGKRDPARASARICVRALRTDLNSLVRRAASECLGRQSPQVASVYTNDLVAALDDANLDVVAMAAWAISTVGDASAVEPMSQLVEHADPRVGTLAYRYLLQLRSRVGLRQTPRANGNGKRSRSDVQLVPAAHNVIDVSPSTEASLSALWLAIYGASSGMLHGALLPAAHGGQAGRQNFILLSFGSSIVGLTAMGVYGLTRANTYAKAHSVVQMGAFGTLSGFGAGILSATGTKQALNVSALSAIGGIIGTGAGIVLAESEAPSISSLGIGALTGAGVGITSAGLALGFDLSPYETFGVAALTASVSGGLTTIALGAKERALIPPLFASVGGLMGAGVLGGGVFLFEGALLSDSPESFTEASGWAVSSGYLVGALLGYGIGHLIPKGLEFEKNALTLKPIGITALRSFDGKSAVPLATLGGQF